MNIGEFNLKNGRLLGWIATHTIDLPRLGLRSVESENDQAPVYEILAQNVSNRWVQIGALWEATSNKTGEVFLQGNIDDPSMPEPLPVALFGTREEGYHVAWRRPKRRDDFAPVTRTNGDGYRDEPRRSNGSSGGMGESTAGDNGDYIGGETSQMLDDEIPFN